MLEIKPGARGRASCKGGLNRNRYIMEKTKSHRVIGELIEVARLKFEKTNKGKKSTQVLKREFMQEYQHMRD